MYERDQMRKTADQIVLRLFLDGGSAAFLRASFTSVPSGMITFASAQSAFWTSDCTQPSNFPLMLGCCFSRLLLLFKRATFHDMETL